MNEQQLHKQAEEYATRFLKELENSKVEQKCDWTCSVWLKERYAEDAKRFQIRLQQAKEHLGESSTSSDRLRSIFLETQVRNTVAQVYSQLFGGSRHGCLV